MPRTLRILTLLVMLCLLALAASANHLHYVQITDTRFGLPPGGVLADILEDPEIPLYEWVVYSGNDVFTTFAPGGLTVYSSVGSGTAEVVADAPSSESDNPLTTGYFEFTLTLLDDLALQTIEIGWTDLINQIKWDEASGVISGSRAGVAGFDVGGIPPWSDHGELPLRIRSYYQFNDFVLTFVVLDDQDNISAPITWQSDGVANPFQNFFPLGGTDPDHLDIYPFLLCEAECELTFSDWNILDCETVEDDVDIANCHTPDLAVSVDDGQFAAIPGQPLTYLLTVTNSGNDGAPAVSVTDQFPESLTGCSWTCAAGGGAGCTEGPVAGDIIDTISLPAASEAVYTATCTLDSAATGVLVNEATISANRDVTSDNNSATDFDVIATGVDLGIINNDSQATAVPGESVTYVLTAINFGPLDAAGATVSDSFPTAVDCDWSCFGSEGAICPVPASGWGDIDALVDLPAGAVASFFATCTIDPAATGSLVNLATVSPPAGTSDPTAGNNSATDIDTLTPQANLEIVGDDGATTAVPGESITYTILAGNPAGPSDAPGSTVSNDFSMVVGDCTWTCAGNGGGSCGTNGEGDIADIANLPVGASVTYSATCTIDSGALGVVSNTATIATAGGVAELDASDNIFTDVDTLTPEADLGITKTDGTAAVLPGDEVTYTIVAGNDGPSDALASSVEDLLPDELIDCSWTCSADPGPLCTTGPVFGDLVDSVDLPSGLQATYTVECTVDPDAVFQSLSNTATITAAAGVTETNADNNTATDANEVPVFRDGFESGDTMAWSVTTGLD